MLHETDFEINKDYWYVFIPKISINPQNVKMEKVILSSMDEYNFTFNVYRYNEQTNEEFPTLDFVIEKNDKKEYPSFFTFDKKEDAEMFWAKEFFKNFKPIHGIEFVDFLDIYKKMQRKHPEWII